MKPRTLIQCCAWVAMSLLAPLAWAQPNTTHSMPAMDMNDNPMQTLVMFDRVEAFHRDHDNGQAIKAHARHGGDINGLSLKLEGEQRNGKLGATRTEALWDHAIAPHWNLLTGVRHDSRDGPGRNWAALGVQGLAPYSVELQATVYAGPSGRSALRLEAEYELRVTRRVVLQPEIELNLYGRNDAARGVGAGLSDINTGLRLRYEFTRKFAPYVGATWSRKFGSTARYARAAGGVAQETSLVAGVRVWF